MGLFSNIWTDHHPSQVHPAEKKQESAEGITSKYEPGQKFGHKL